MSEYFCSLSSVRRRTCHGRPPSRSMRTMHSTTAITKKKLKENIHKYKNQNHHNNRASLLDLMSYFPAKFTDNLPCDATTILYHYCSKDHVLLSLFLLKRLQVRKRHEIVNYKKQSDSSLKSLKLPLFNELKIKKRRRRIPLLPRSFPFCSTAAGRNCDRPAGPPTAKAIASPTDRYSLQRRR